ncbi:unnamed protein product [Rotaria sp. Silwood1]|nr:unnamed protein product [Rotaria sp. Silwood1]CAF1684914.1 unnamed protein product [Rotaria sp. Silwood1]
MSLNLLIQLIFDKSDIDTWSILCIQVSNGIMSIIVSFLGLDNHDYIKNNYYISLMPDVLPALIGFIRLEQLIQMQTTNTIQNLNIISRYLENPDDSYDLLQNIDMITNFPSRSLLSSTSSNQTNQGRYIVLDFHSFDA